MAGAPASRSGGRRSTTRTATVSLTRPLLLFFSAALLLPLLAARAAHAKGLDVTLKARWEGTSFVLEAAEFLVRGVSECVRRALAGWSSSSSLSRPPPPKPKQNPTT